MTFRILAAAAAGLTLLGSAMPASSQALIERGETIAAPTPPAWSLTLGAFGGLRPDYMGSDDCTGFAAPLVDLRFRDLVFLSSRDGLGVSVLRGAGSPRARSCATASVATGTTTMRCAASAMSAAPSRAAASSAGRATASW